MQSKIKDRRYQTSAQFFDKHATPIGAIYPILHASCHLARFGRGGGGCIKHLNMNLEYFCTSQYAYFDIFSLNMSKVTNSTRFFFFFFLGTSCIFPKICQNKAKIHNLCLYLWPKICTQKWHKNYHKLVKNG